MEVPIERDPEHHSYLSGWACRRLEVIGRRIRDGRDEEAIVLEGRLRIRVDMGFVVAIGGGVSASILSLCDCTAWDFESSIIFRVYDDGPAYREGIVVGIEVVGFEEEAGEDRRHGDIAPVGQMDYLGPH